MGEWYWLACPFGDVGDRIGVREAWSPDHAVFYPNYPVVYRADECGPDIENGMVFSPEQNASYPFRWRSSATMPAWASRLTVENVAVRIEQREGVWHWAITVRRIDPQPKE